MSNKAGMDWIDPRDRAAEEFQSRLEVDHSKWVWPTLAVAFAMCVFGFLFLYAMPEIAKARTEAQHLQAIEAARNMPAGYEEEHILLQDGRYVVCVNMLDHGISCDWANAK